MAELTDYEIQEIKRYIESFSKKANALTKTLGSDYSYKLSEAKRSLSSYSKQEEEALKNARKEIERVSGASGGWGNGRNNINEVIKEKGEESSREISKIIEQYSSDVNAILKELPHVSDNNS